MKYSLLFLVVTCFIPAVTGCGGRAPQNVAENASQEAIDAYNQEIEAQEAAMSAGFAKGDPNGKK